MLPPTFIASYSATYTSTATSQSVSVTTQPGDILVVYGGGEGPAAILGTPSGNSVSFTLQQSIVTSGYCTAYIWTGTDATGGTNWTLSCAMSSGDHWGFSCLVFRGSGGVGTSGQAHTTGAPSLTLSTTSNNSALVSFSDDFNNVNGSSRTWRTINGITPSSGTSETNYTFLSSSYTSYGAYWPDTGASGSVTLGLSAPTGQKYSLVGVEILGAPASAGPIAAPFITA